MAITEMEMFRPNTGIKYSMPEVIEETEGKETAGIGRSKSIDMANELAIIQAMSQNVSPSGGIGRNVGGVVGTGVGAVIGGPTGAAIGGTAAGTIGSIVDYMIDSDSKKRAEQKRIDALRKAKISQTQKANSIAWLNRLAESKAIGVSEFEKKMDRYLLARRMRDQFIKQLFGKMAATKARKENVNQNFIQSRGLV